MRRPEPTYEFYASAHRGSATEEQFSAALPLAAARARDIVRCERIPARCRAPYLHAVCALVDRVAGIDARGTVRSETVGSTSLTYADADAGASFADADAVRPWLAGTGLLYQGLG